MLLRRGDFPPGVIDPYCWRPRATIAPVEHSERARWNVLKAGKVAIKPDGLVHLHQWGTFVPAMRAKAPLPVE